MNCLVELRKHQKRMKPNHLANPSLLHLHAQKKTKGLRKIDSAQRPSPRGHLRTHFPKNPFCKICSVAKTTSARVAKKPDTKADDLIEAPTKPFEQLATHDVTIAKSDDHVGIGVGGVKTHHVVRDVFSGARVAYPMSRRGAPQHARNFRHFLGRKTGEHLHPVSSRWTKQESSSRQA